jgi:hypothetical protein
MNSKKIAYMLLVVSLLLTGCGKKSEIETDAKKLAKFQCDLTKAMKHQNTPEMLESLNKLASQEEYFRDLKKKYESEKYTQEDRALLLSTFNEETAKCMSEDSAPKNTKQSNNETTAKAQTTQNSEAVNQENSNQKSKECIDILIAQNKEETGRDPNPTELQLFEFSCQQ